mmetsp:Transcript_67374/g.197829  ORF Transcript_67374/g.197829 Transcript_67374/m.197829 type:complete len:228 (-) Transcript_67374:126-809(-)
MLQDGLPEHVGEPVGGLDPRHRRRRPVHHGRALAIDDANHGELALVDEDHVVSHLALPHGDLVAAEAALGEAVGHRRDVLRRDQAVLEGLLDAREPAQEPHALLDELPVQLRGAEVEVRPLCHKELRSLNAAGREVLLGQLVLHDRLAEAAPCLHAQDLLEHLLALARALLVKAARTSALGLRLRLQQVHTTREDDAVLVRKVVLVDSEAARLERLDLHHAAQGASE